MSGCLALPGWAPARASFPLLPFCCPQGSPGTHGLRGEKGEPGMTVRSHKGASTGSWHSGHWGGKGCWINPTATEVGAALTSGLC